MKEHDFLKNFAKILGAETTFEEIEEKKQREKLMLERLSAQFGVQRVEKEEREIPDVFLKQHEPQIVEEVIEVEPVVEVQPKPEPIVENVIPPMPQLPLDTIITKSVEKISKAAPDKIQQAVNDIPESMRRELDAMKKSIADFHRFAQRHSQHGGGGEVNLRWLDDVARETISDGRYLRYDGPSKKFVFDEIATGDVVYNTTYVTTPTYTIQDGDYYIGVNYNGPVTITLPISATSGRTIIIKDEDSDAETKPITVLGNVDNDPGGFIIQINNGAIQMIYRDGWRII